MSGQQWTRNAAACPRYRRNGPLIRRASAQGQLSPMSRLDPVFRPIVYLWHLRHLLPADSADTWPFFEGICPLVLLFLLLAAGLFAHALPRISPHLRFCLLHDPDLFPDFIEFSTHFWHSFIVFVGKQAGRVSHCVFENCANFFVDFEEFCASSHLFDLLGGWLIGFAGCFCLESMGFAVWLRWDVSSKHLKFISVIILIYRVFGGEHFARGLAALNWIGAAHFLSFSNSNEFLSIHQMNNWIWPTSEFLE